MATFFKISRSAANAGEADTISQEITSILDTLLTNAGWSHVYTKGTGRRVYNIIHSTPYGSTGWIEVWHTPSDLIINFAATAAHTSTGTPNWPTESSSLKLNGTFPYEARISGMVDEWGITLFGHNESAGDGDLDGGRQYISAGVFDRRKLLPANQVGMAVTTSGFSGPAGPATFDVDRDLRGYLRTPDDTGFAGQLIDIFGQSDTNYQFERNRVLDVTATQVTIDNITDTYEPGAIIGFMADNPFTANEYRQSTDGPIGLWVSTVFDGDLAQHSGWWGNVGAFGYRQPLDEHSQWNNVDPFPQRCTVSPTFVIDTSLSQSYIGFVPHLWLMAPQRSPADFNQRVLGVDDRIRIGTGPEGYLVAPHGAFAITDPGWGATRITKTVVLMGPGAPRPFDVLEL